VMRGRCEPCRTGCHCRWEPAVCGCWCTGDTDQSGWNTATADRVAGGLWGLCVGDALGATCEFMRPAEIVARLGRHTEIVGGGVFGWAAGQGTDDSDLAVALARAYAQDYSLERVATGFLGWYRSRPRDIGGTTAAALRSLDGGADPHRSGRSDERSAANGGLMRAVATGLARPGAEERRTEAAEVSAITHAERRCIQAAIAYCDLVNHLAGVALQLRPWPGSWRSRRSTTTSLVCCVGPL